MTPRPSEKDYSVKKAAAKRVAEALMKWEKEAEGERVSDLEDWMKPAMDVVEDCRFENGYRLAKKLDERYHVEPTTGLVEMLDDCELYLHDAIYKAVKDWVIAEGIPCPFQIGDEVKFKDQRSKKILDGEIARIWTEEARVTVYCEELGHIRNVPGKTGTHGQVIAYEDLFWPSGEPVVLCGSACHPVEDPRQPKLPMLV
jgi:hypothetical protein